MSLILFMMLEILFRIMVHVGGLQIPLPSYSLSDNKGAWRDRDSIVGKAHEANTTYYSRKSCFDVEYVSNNSGFRDFNWPLKSNETRAVVLGDSYGEGIGIDTARRFSNLLTKKTGIDHMNFCMGDTGPTQYYLTYKSKAHKYDHDIVIVMVFPRNDFMNDDLSLAQQNPKKDYRPYWKGSYPDYKLTYYKKDMLNADIKKRSWFKTFLEEFTYSYSAIRHYWHKLTFEPPKSKAIGSGYHEFKNDQFDRLKYNIESIKALAKDKRVIVVTNPEYNEITGYEAKRKNKLGDRLGKYLQRINVEYIDLLPVFYAKSNDNIRKLFLPCDTHWSEYGHEFVADTLQTKILNGL